MSQDKPALFRRALKKTATIFRRFLPSRLVKMAEDRVFYVVFNTTRVTNDAYGWRPEETESGGEQ